MSVKNPGQLEVLTSVGDLDLYNDLSLIWDKSAAKLKGILPSNLPVPDQDGVFYASRYGATGDGVTDDTSAIASLRAAAYAYASGGLLASVIFDPGIYKVTDASLFEIFDNLSIVGYGATIYFPSGGTVRDTTATQTYVYDNGLFYSTSSDIDTFSMFGLTFNIDDSRVCGLQIGDSGTLNGSITGSNIFIEDCTWDGGGPNIVIGCNDVRWYNNVCEGNTNALFVRNNNDFRTMPSGAIDIVSFGAVGDEVTDSTLAIQAALDVGGQIFIPLGRYKFTSPLIFYEDTSVTGATYDANTRFIASYSGSDYPVQIMGTNTDDGEWVYNVLFENVYFDASGWTGSATHFMNVSGIFSSALRHVTIDTTQSTKRAVRIGKSNWLTLDGFRIYQTGADVTVGIDVDSEASGGAGEINGLLLSNIDVELATTGVLFTSTTNIITCDMVGCYFEACDIYVDWNSADIESKLAIIGGHMAQRAGSTGVKIRQSNCTIIGLGTNSAGDHAVDIDGASTHLNCHVIGGNLRAGINDSNGWLSTDTTFSCSGSKTFNPNNLNDGDQQMTDVNVPGAVVGRFAQASFSNDLSGINLHAHVYAADTVRCVFQNETGGAINLASGTLYVKVT